jgi:hypothetical protein
MNSSTSEPEDETKANIPVPEVEIFMEGPAQKAEKEHVDNHLYNKTTVK